MSLEGIVAGLLAIAVGLAWAFYGLKAFTILLPIVAFFFGVITGAQWAQDVFGQGFIIDVLSLIIGIVFGVVLAVLSYFWYYAAVTIAAGILGYSLGVGFMDWLGIDAQVLGITIGIIVGALLAIATFLLGVPAFLIIYLSAITGAAAAVNGILLVLGRIKLEDLDSGVVNGLLTDSAIGIILWIVIAIAAAWYQLRDVARTVVAVERSSYRY